MHTAPIHRHLDHSPIARVLAAILLGVPLITLQATDWCSWRGPTADGRSPETGLELVWGSDGPRIPWRADVNASASGVSIADGRVYTVGSTPKERKQSVERTIWCLEAATGRALWQHVSEEGWGMSIGYIGHGTTATPIVDAGRVYVMGRRGSVLCLDAVTGKPLWERADLVSEYQLHPSHVGAGGAPVIVGDVLVLNICRPHGVGLDKHNGSTLWVSDTSRTGWNEEKDKANHELGASHAGLIPDPAAGDHGVLFFAGDGLRSIDARTGDERWFYKHGSYHNHNIPSPLVIDKHIAVCKKRASLTLLDTSSASPSVVYQKKRKELDTVVGCGFAVHHDGFLYGVGNCFRLEDGAVRYPSPFLHAKWQQGADGGVILVDGKLVMVTGSGSLIVAEPDPDTFTPLCQSDQIFTPRPEDKRIYVWAPPSFSDGRLFIRSTTELVCIDMR